MGLLNIDLNNINIDDYFDEDGPNTIILVRLLNPHIKSGKCKELEEELSEELLLVQWHLNRWWDWSMSEDDRKETNKMFIE